MNLRIISAFLMIWLCLVREAIAVNESIATSRGFLIYRTISITQRSCNCSMSFSCSCCQRVIILYTKQEKNLCVNFTYQRNGLNVDVALSSDAINTRTITDFKPLQFCVYVPGCFFSTACINIVELNRFPRSITACLRLDIYAKKQLWQINYDCISVSTELPTTMNGKIPMMENGQMGQSPMTESTIAMASTEMMIMQTEMSGAEEMTEMMEMTAEEMPVD